MHFNIILCFWAHLDSVLCCGLTFEVPAILGIKYSTSEKNQYSMIEVLGKISSILYFIIKYIHVL